jgi:hypothetical protein
MHASSSTHVCLFAFAERARKADAGKSLIDVCVSFKIYPLSSDWSKKKALGEDGKPPVAYVIIM